jgi:drug/metabolite transporter (DMT)-like permease
VRRHIILIAFLVGALLAGGNGVAIRFSNRELDPLWGAGLRFALAALLLLPVMFALKIPVPGGRALIGVVVWGLLQFAGAFGFGYYALVRMHAGIGQILLALVPLVTLLLAGLQRQERIRATALVGTVLGLVGVSLISRDTLRDVPMSSLLAVFAGVLCFAEGAILVRKFPSVHPVAQNAIGMLVGSVVLIGLSMLIGQSLVLPRLSATWIALGYVVIVGSIGVFMLYVFVLQHWAASRAAYTFVLIPFVTVMLSAWLDNERVGPGLVLGGLLVLTGVYIGALRTPSESGA